MPRVKGKAEKRRKNFSFKSPWSKGINCKKGERGDGTILRSKDLSDLKRFNVENF